MTISDTWAPKKNSGTGQAAPRPFQIMSADGAITIAEGLVLVTKAGVCAMTIANPPTGMNGARLDIVAGGAYAHTVTYTPGFGGLGGSYDVATFGGAAGDTLTLFAYNGVWYSSNPDNVSQG